MLANNTELQSFFLLAKDSKHLHELHMQAITDSKSGSFLLGPLNFYLEILNNTYEVMFEYMPPEQKESLNYDLQMTLRLLLAQMEYEVKHQKTEYVVSRLKDIKKCKEQLKLLNLSYLDEGPSSDLLGRKSLLTSRSIKYYLHVLNMKRLYWVWGFASMKSLLELFPDEYDNVRQALGIPDPYMGNLSWMLYCFRFFLNLSLLLKHHIEHKWMSDEEKILCSSERFKLQWQQRELVLINDFFWGLANFACTSFLKGSFLADALTLILLLVDCRAANKSFKQQKKQYGKEISSFKSDIQKLSFKKNIPLTSKQIDTLHRLMNQHKKNWLYEEESLKYDCLYAYLLVAAFFVLLVAPLTFTPALTTAIGAVTCLSLTIVYNLLRHWQEWNAAKEAKAVLENNWAEQRQKLARSTLDSNESKLIYLELLKLEVDLKNQNYLINVLFWQQLLITTALDVSKPFALFSFLLPNFYLGICLLVILDFGNKLLVDYLKENKEEKHNLEFDENKYKNYQKTCTFFSPQSRNPALSPQYKFGNNSNGINKEQQKFISPINNLYTQDTWKC